MLFGKTGKNLMKKLFVPRQDNQRDTIKNLLILGQSKTLTCANQQVSGFANQLARFFAKR